MDTPIEKLRKQGAAALSPVELLAIGFTREEGDAAAALQTARAFMKNLGGIRSLASVPPGVLKEAGILDDLEIARFTALIELGRRCTDAGKGQRTIIKGDNDIADLFKHLRHERKEHFCALLLDTKCQVMKSTVVHTGTVSASLVGVREFFREALLEGASSIIAVHNHPSGDPTPSREDFEVTNLLVQAGKLLEISLLDHVIIGETDHVSLQKLGAIG